MLKKIGKISLILGSFVFTINAVAELQVTADPLILHSLGSGKVFIPSDLSIGVEYSPNGNLWFGPEVSLYALVDDVAEIGHEEGLRIRTGIFKASPSISIDLSSSFGIANILLKKLGSSRDFSSSSSGARTSGPYAGALIGPFIRFPNPVTLFVAAGTKYYFLQKSIEGISNRRSGFILDVEASLGFILF